MSRNTGGRRQVWYVLALLITVAAGGSGWAQTDTGPATTDIERIKAWDADLAAFFDKNFQLIKQLAAEKEAITKGHSFLAKDENGQPFVSEEDRVKCDWIMKRRGLYIDLNKAMILLAELHEKGGAESALAPKFAAALGLIKEIQDLTDREYITKATKTWNDLVDVYNDLKKALK
ncbi:MAG: hypothetical protein JXQ27_12965 [Acidobacteria bacterium]|nr:hypothetical protein [Acidobacteriota bacterium]